MRNQTFNINISHEDGTIRSLVSEKDIAAMNWCSDIMGWGSIRFFDNTVSVHPQTRHQSVNGFKWMNLVEHKQNDNTSTSVYESSGIRVSVERCFDDDGYLNERYTLKNLRDTDLFLEQGDIGIALPYNDIYTYADDCMTNRCNTHLWCAGYTTYVNAVKMGVSEVNLGLVVTEGAVASYSLSHADKHSRRGVFILDCEHLELLSGEEYVWNWKLFWYNDNDEFHRIISKYKNTIEIEAERYTLFRGETLKCGIKLSFVPEKLTVIMNDVELSTTGKDGTYYIEYIPEQPGDNRLYIFADDIHTHADFFISETPEVLIKKRLYFIAEKQQYKKKESPLYGAYLIYDNIKKYLIFDSENRDHNACRERMGMALLMCRYLQNNEDTFLRASLNNFVAFLEREFYDTETGEVFDGIGKNKKYIRLYNAPWVVTFFAEMYNLTGDKEYLTYCLNSLTVYYKGGGDRFYPNGLSMRLICEAFRKAGMEQERQTVENLFRKHVENIANNGLSYPKHEVNYEQTIVTPAVTFLSEYAWITEDDYYTKEARKHIKALERFSGHQPSCHMNEIPIRYWDDFWFGSRRMQGDTFPHYWSCLTARSYMAYYNVSGECEYKIAAEECIRNCFCLFKENGEASCAYMYPYRVNERKGEFYDEWANDQDFALYFYMVIQEQKLKRS